MAGSSKKVIIAALIGNSLIAVTKFIAAAMTGSSAMLSEGIHSVVDTGNQLLLLYGMKQASKPADAHYPYGHGKEIYFWNFVVSILIFAVGAGVSLYEGVLHLLHPVPMENPMINYIVLGFAMLFEGGSWFVALRVFRRVKGPLGYVDAVHEGKDPSMFVVLFEDSAAMLGLLVALVGITLGHWTGIAYFDGVASILIGLILAGTAAWLAYETKSLLIGESARPEVVESIRRLASDHEIVTGVNEILTMHMGPDFILANLSIDFDDSRSAGEVERFIARLDRRIKEKHPEVKRVFIEAEPCCGAEA